MSVGIYQFDMYPKYNLHIDIDTRTASIITFSRGLSINLLLQMSSAKNNLFRGREAKKGKIDSKGLTFYS